MKHLLLIAMLMLFMMSGAFAQENEWQLTDAQSVEELFEGSIRDAALSPDGTMVAGAGDEEICIFYLRLDHEKCFSTEDTFQTQVSGSDYHNPFVWSPDSSQILFHEDLYIRFTESDLWTLDVDTGTITNLTDDNALGGILGLDDTPYTLDYLPAFAPNGDIYFFRSTRTQGNFTLSLQRLSAGSDTPEEVVDLTRTLPVLSIFYSPAVSPDGTQIAFPVVAQQPDEPRNGLWLIDLSTGEASQLTDNADARVGLPESMAEAPLRMMNPAWLPDSTALVAKTFSPEFFGSNQPAQNYVYIDATSGTVTPVVDLSDFPPPQEAFQTDEDGFSAFIEVPRSGAVSADGSAFIYVRQDNVSNSAQLALVPLPPIDSEPIVIDELEWTQSRIQNPNPQMSADNKALLTGWLFTLES